MSKPTKSKLKLKAWNLLSKIIRSKGKCERCGNTNYLQAAHIVGRNNHTLRFDPMNLLCLCVKCHRWGHDNPDAFTDWWRNKYPARKIYIDHNRNRLTKRNVQDYEEMIIMFKKMGSVYE